MPGEYPPYHVAYRLEQSSLPAFDASRAQERTRNWMNTVSATSVAQWQDVPTRRLGIDANQGRTHTTMREFHSPAAMTRIR